MSIIKVCVIACAEKILKLGSFVHVDVMAAGRALGYAGEWEGMLRYVENSANAQTLGQVSACQQSPVLLGAVPV